MIKELISRRALLMSVSAIAITILTAGTAASAGKHEAEVKKSMGQFPLVMNAIAAGDQGPRRHHRPPPIYVTEQFDIASDGTPLHWLVQSPVGNGPWPAILLIHGGGWQAGDPYSPLRVCGPDLNAAGYIVFSPEYRLAFPGKLAGQRSSGQYPDQTDDVKLAIEDVRNDPRITTLVGTVGGSAGGYQAAWWAANGVLPGVAMSPATDLDDTVSLQDKVFEQLALNYAPNDLAAASPMAYVRVDSLPIFVRAYAQDNMPGPQFDNFVMAYDREKLECDAAIIPGRGHSLKMWPSISADAITFLNRYR